MNTVLLEQLIQLFMIMGAGYVLFKLKYIDVPFSQKLTKILLDVTLPMMILASVMKDDEEKDFAKIGKVFFFSFALYVFMTVLSIVTVKLLHFPAKQQGIYMFMCMFSNTGFMGYPVINALFGSEAMIYAAIVNVFFNIFVFTVGIVMINYDGGGNKDGGSIASLIDLKHLLTPGTLCSLAAVLLYFLPVHYPTVLTGFCSTLGGLTSGLAMLVIGSTLAKIPVKSIFNDWHVYLFTVIRQIAFAFILWPVMKLAVSDELIRAVMFILMIMPVGNTAVLLAGRYEKDEELAAKTVFVTTFVSIITIPLCLEILKVI